MNVSINMLIFMFVILQVTMAQIERKQPEIERVMDEVNDLCQEPWMDDEDRVALEQKLNDLRTNYNEVRTDALQKETRYVNILMNLKKNRETTGACFDWPIFAVHLTSGAPAHCSF